MERRHTQSKHIEKLFKEGLDKSICDFFRGPEFGSQHLPVLGRSQLPMIAAPGDLMASLAFVGGHAHTHTHSIQMHTYT